MAGVPGAGGPPPKRSDQRRRRNKTDPITKAKGATKVTIPRADPKWHPAAARWYRSLKDSGQSSFYEPSDWALAWLIAESISRDLKPQAIGINEQTGKAVMAVIPMKGASLAAYLKAMTALMVTEGDRRRARLELTRDGEGGGDSDVIDLDAFRDRFAG